MNIDRIVHCMVSTCVNHQPINRKGTLKPKVFGIIDFTASYHQTPLGDQSIICLLLEG